MWTCTPLEAMRELRENPYLGQVMAAELYRRAYIELDEWRAMTPDQRKDRKAPDGPWVTRVRTNRARLAERDSAARDAALKRQGRA